MELGFVGLGRMGGNMVTRLLQDKHTIVAYDRGADAVAAAAGRGARTAGSLAELVKTLAPPRAVWVMVPAGEATENTIRELATLLSRGDTVIDGGNTNYKDDVRRGQELAARGLHYVDAGTSGGIWGLKVGYCLMVGGDREPVARLEPLFRSLAPANGYLHVGGIGAGHYVKMVHNGIEYAMMQAYAEGFELMAESSYGLDLPKIAATARWLAGFVRATRERAEPIAFADAGSGDAATLDEVGELLRALAPLSVLAEASLPGVARLRAACDRAGRLPDALQPELAELVMKLESGLAG